MKRNVGLWLAVCAGLSISTVGAPAAAEPQGTHGNLPPSFAKGPKGPYADYFSAYKFMADAPLRPNETPVPYSGGSEDAAFAYLGLQRGNPQAWEDGLRTNPDQFAFEWWYYDAHFQDGSSLVVVYYTKPLYTPGAPFTPYVEVTIVTAAGETIAKRFFTTPSNAGFSSQSADLYIGPSHTKDVNGDLRSYTLYAKIDDVEVNLTMQSLVPAWRPNTGHLFFGQGYGTSFGWLPAIASGVTTGSMTYNGTQHQNLLGSGYHDHNWGNTRIYDHQKYWWWSRSQVGPYTVIAVNQRLKNRFGNNVWAPVFVILDQNGALIDAATPNVSMTHTESNIGPHFDPNFAGSDDGNIAHTVTFRAQGQNGNWAEIRIDAMSLLASVDLKPAVSLGMSELENSIAADLGRDPWYTRVLGAAQLSFNINGVVYQGSGFSTLELMDLE